MDKFWTAPRAYFDKSLILLALPTEARQFGDINGLAPSLGKCGPIEPQGLFSGRPKPEDPPQKETAAPADHGTAAKESGKRGRSSEVDYSNTDLCTATGIPRIVALHFFGLQAEVKPYCDSTVDDDGLWACPIAGSPECERCPRRQTMRRPPRPRQDDPPAEQVQP